MMMNYLLKELPTVIQLEKKMFVTFDWTKLMGSGIVVLSGVSLRFTESVLLRYTEGLSYVCCPIGETEHENDKVMYCDDISELVNTAITPSMLAKDWTEFFTTRAHLVPALPIEDCLKNEVKSWIFRGGYVNTPLTLTFTKWEDFEKAHRVFDVPFTNIIHRVGTHIKNGEFYGSVYPVKSIIHSRKADAAPIPIGIQRIPGLKFVLLETWEHASEPDILPT